MENKVLLYLSLASAIIGLFIIYFAAENVEPSITSIGKITYEDVGKNAKVCGQISAVRLSQTKHLFFTIEDHTGEIDAVIFNSSIDKFESLDKGDLACVLGTIDEYEDRLEIIPKQVIKQ